MCRIPIPSAPGPPECTTSLILIGPDLSSSIAIRSAAYSGGGFSTAVSRTRLGGLITIGMTWIPRVTRPYWQITNNWRSEEHTSELQSRLHLVCRLLLEKKKKK